MNRILNKIKEKGIKNSFKILLSHIYKKSNIYSGIIGDISQRDKFIKIVEIDISFLMEEERCLEEIGGRKYSIFIERLNNEKNFGFILEKENTILGYFWILVGRIEENSTGYTKEIYDDEIYLYDFFIMENQRGKGVTNEIFYFIRNFCKINGVEKSYCIIDSLNVISQNMFTKFNFKKIGYFITLKFRNRSKIILSRFKR